MKDINILLNNGININSSLELFGDINTYDETLSEYLNGINEKVSNLKKYKEMSDSYNYSIVAHSLKSDSKYLGFTDLANLCLEHEMAGKNNDISLIYEKFDLLMNEINRINSIASKYLGVAEEKIEEPIIESHLDKRILVVDDSDIITNYIKRVFSDRFDVVTASDGAKAIDMVTNDFENKIIGMLLDLNLPNVNGFEVLDYFQKNNLFEKVPVTIITGSDSTTDINKVFMYPVIDVLNKPFNERDLKSVLDKMFKE